MHDAIQTLSIQSLLFKINPFQVTNFVNEIFHLSILLTGSPNQCENIYSYVHILSVENDWNVHTLAKAVWRDLLSLLSLVATSYGSRCFHHGTSAVCTAKWTQSTLSRLWTKTSCCTSSIIWIQSCSILELGDHKHFLQPDILKAFSGNLTQHTRYSQSRPRHLNLKIFSMPSPASLPQLARA